MAGAGLNGPGNAWRTWGNRLRDVSVLGVLLALAGVAGVLVVGWLIVVDDPLGGQPVAVVALDRPSAVQTETGEDIEIRPTMDSRDTDPLPDGHAQPPADVVISDPLAETRPMREPRVTRTTLDPGLVENGRYGPLPRIARDGRQPSEVYANAPGAARTEAPKIALLIGGMGLSSTTTEAAIDKLPPQVALAFAPYGKEIDRLTSRARQAGHELALQVPLEPYDYPDNDPGPHTLLTGLSQDQNRDRLHWVMSRFTGYIGVLNYMGARFTGSDEALRPVLGELRDRGLFYFDDGTSPRAITGKVADEIGLTFARADVVIDEVPAASRIEEALDELVKIARSRGLAIGVGSGLPVTIDTVDAWAHDLERDGVVLVPVSTVVTGGQT